MLEEVQTGRLLTTLVLPASTRDLRSLERSWQFDWLAEVMRAEVFKLVVREAPDTIQGLMSLRRKRGFIEVCLLESGPPNVGRNKHLKGIAGSLLAFAARLSFRSGNEGYVRIVAKTQLIEHYQRVYGFAQLGNTQLMVLDTVAANKLISMFQPESE